MYPDNARLAAVLEARGCALRFEHWSGGHSREFWDRSVERAMEALMVK